MNMIPTLNQFLLNELSEHPERAEIIMIMSDIATIGKYINQKTIRAGLVNILGKTGDVNVQGEEVKKLDIVANDICKKYLRATGHFAAMASEEDEGVVDMGEFGANSNYVIAFDPLDGSSNIDINASIGTIFSVHRRLPEIDRIDSGQFLQAGRDQVLAGYILYGSSTVLMFSFGEGVHEFTLDPDLGEFLLSNENVKIPDVCKYYSVNESYYNYFKEEDKRLIDFLKYDKKTSLRYIGALVADIHRGLIKGGVYLYPATDKTGSGEYKPKLRLNFELKPMGFLLEKAGGFTTDGVKNILDIVPTELHQRVSVIMGNSEVIKNHYNIN